MNILWLQSSPREESVSTKLAEALITKVMNLNKAAFLLRENLAQSPPPHLTEAQLSGFFTPEDQLTEVQRVALRASDRYIYQLRSSDLIIISFPVWNFSVPSSLKAWVDQVVRVGKTFKYVDSRPTGLLENKKVYLVSARGGIYSESDLEAVPFDSSVLLMKTVLSYIGLTDLVELRVDGVAIPGNKEEAFTKALARLENLVM